MISFLSFLDSQPDVTPHMRRIYLCLDAAATRIGRDRANNGIDYRYQAMHAGSTWAACVNREIADALETDVRLAAITDLYAWVMSGQAGEISTTHVNWYIALLRRHVAQARQQKEAA